MRNFDEEQLCLTGHSRLISFASTTTARDSFSSGCTTYQTSTTSPVEAPGDRKTYISDGIPYILTERPSKTTERQ